MVHFNKAFKQLDHELIPKAWDKAIETFYEEQFLPRVKPHLAGNPSLDTFAPQSQASRFLQYHYLAANQHPVGDKQRLDDAGDGSGYSQFHQRYHPLFQALVEQLGYGNLYLIDFDTQNIVYTVSKEVDFGTSLQTGPYAGSGLAEAVQAVREQPIEGAVHAIDFRFYTPSYGAPVAFFAIPLYNGPHIVGILAMQYPVDELNNVMTGNRNWKADGLGDSGETYLVGSDFRMRSASRFFIEDPEGYAKTLAKSNVPQPTIDAIQQFGTTILLQQVDTASARAALRGEDGVRMTEDYRGMPALSAYAPLQLPEHQMGHRGGDGAGGGHAANRTAATRAFNCHRDPRVGRHHGSHCAVESLCAARGCAGGSGPGHHGWQAGCGGAAHLAGRVWPPGPDLQHHGPAAASSKTNTSKRKIARTMPCS